LIKLIGVVELLDFNISWKISFRMLLAVMDVNMSTLGATLYSDVKPIFERKDRFA